MSYGAVIIDDNPIIVFNYGNGNYVSCTSIIVNDMCVNNNYRTICCSNKNCQYGQKCRFYHDPIIIHNSTHIQRFYKNAIIKFNPYFGDSMDYIHQKNITFEDLRSLARYCAIMNMLIHDVSMKNNI